MEFITLGGKSYPVKDYYCAESDEVYLPKKDRKLWLYINLTSLCNGGCPFCVNPSVNTVPSTVSIPRLRQTLQAIRDHVGGISITGGEPMLFPELVDETAGLVQEILGPEISLEMVTNGTNLDRIATLRMLPRFTGIHLSRHRTEDRENAVLMGFPAPEEDQIRNLIRSLPDPAVIVLNCVLQRGGVGNLEQVSQYLEMAARTGVRNTSFIGMFPANQYCLEQYISPGDLDFSLDSRFEIWTRFHDHAICSCCSGDYCSEQGYVRFYYRCPGSGHAEYLRHLVYSHDDRLLTSFGGKEISLP